MEAALKPAVRAAGRMAEGCMEAEMPLESSITGEDGKFDDDTNGGKDRLQHSLIGQEGLEVPSEIACEAAAAAADAAVDFVAPLMKQVSVERTRALSDGKSESVNEAEAGRHVLDFDIMTDVANTAPVNGASKILAASDRSLVAYMGFALSALDVALETSPLASSVPVTPGDCPPAAALARAEERLVGLIMDNPVIDIDLRFILLHSCRVSYANRGKKETEGHLAMRSPRKGYASFGDLALTGAMPWTLRGVSCLAYMVRNSLGSDERWNRYQYRSEAAVYHR